MYDPLRPQKLSLKRFLDKVAACADWREQIDGLLPLMPDTEDCLREMAWLPRDERDAMRTQLGYFLAVLGEYLKEKRAALQQQRIAVQQAGMGTQAVRHYHAAQAIAPTVSPAA